MSLLNALAFVSIAMQADTTRHMHDMHPAPADPAPQVMPAMVHPMLGADLPGGWRLSLMAQMLPIFTVGESLDGGSMVDVSEFYLTQPATMLNLESPGQRVALRVTPNFEGLTIEDGELTFGGWGEGFIDRRHPHTLLHELMLSVNVWSDGDDGFSLSAGKGFAPYGTDDPMSRPSSKYPTNHHLSQILERFTVNAVWLRDGWGVEAGVFGGSEPDGPYDLSNIDSFGDSWSARVSKRLGTGPMGARPWELSASYGRVAAAHGDGEAEVTALYNGAIRFDGQVGTNRHMYGLVEYSISDPAEHEGYWSLLGEVALRRGAHRPYLRLEHSTRPEYPREAASGEGFFRYDHDAEPLGATAWTIGSLGWGWRATDGKVSLRPFVEGQVFSVSGHRGPVGPDDLYGDDRFAALTIGARIFFGGGPMRMGSYGVLDDMTRMGRDGGMGGMMH